MVVVPLNRHDFYVIYQMWQCLVFDEKSDVKMFFFPFWRSYCQYVRTCSLVILLSVGFPVMV